jgi:hypothetical protein
MSIYRISRNLEASIIDFLKEQLENENWNDINVEKSFKRAVSESNKNTAVICVRASDTNRSRIEIGTDSVQRAELVIIDVFATSDGQRLDLVDFLGDILKNGLPYLEYQTNENNVLSSIQNGRIRVTNLSDTPVNFNTDKSQLDISDRYRHTISLTISLGRAEA